MACTYAVRRDTSEEAQELLGLLKTLPEYRAFAAIRLLRASNGDCAAALSVLKAGEGDVPTPPEHNTDRDAAAVQTSTLEMELSCRHPVAYPVQPRVVAAVLLNSNLLHPVPSAQPPPSSARSPLSLGLTGRPADSNLAGSSSLARHGVQPIVPEGPAYPHVSLQAPYIDADSAVNSYRFLESSTAPQTPPVQYCDHRLEALRISYWTSVPVSDNFAARVISLYLVTDHPLVGTFDPDLFVADLVDQRQAFCSPVLVNALLYWGCVRRTLYRCADPSLTMVRSKCTVPSTGLPLSTQSDSVLRQRGYGRPRKTRIRF